MKGEHPLLVITLVFLHVVNGCPHVCTCNSKAKTVDCRGRGLTEVPSILYFDMQELYLQNNNIRTVHTMAFREATALKVLDLSNNSIANLSEGAFQGLHNLVVLNLANNLIQNIDKRLFISLRSLSELNLSFNHITSLPGALGNDIKNLTRLSVRHNLLQKLDRTLVEPLSKLQALFIHNNPWMCDCQIIGFKLWLESFLFKGGTIDDIKCQQPDELLETDLRKVPYEIFQTCPSSSYNHLLASIHHTDSTHKASRLHVQSDHAGESLPECEPKQRPRPVNLRHAIATVVITGVVCGIVCLMMLAAAVYGCAYAAIMAKYHRELKDVDQLPPTTEQGSPEEKEPLDGNIA